MRQLILILSLLFCLSAAAQPTDSQLYESGITASRAGKYEEAIGHYKKATSLNPSNGEAWYELGWCYNEVEKYEDGLQAMLKAKEVLGEQPRVYFELGYSYQRTDRPREAQQHYEKCIELKSDYSVAHRQLATVHFESNNDFVAALKHYQLHVKYARPENISSLSWFRKAYCEVEVGDFETALLSLDKSIAADNTNIDAWNEKGYIHFEQGHAGYAIEAYESSLAVDTINAAAYKGLGDVYRVLTHETDKAYANYSKAVVLNPGNAINHFGMAWCYNDKHEFEKAIPYLQKAIEINGGEAAYHAELGYTYYGLQKYDLALAAIDRSLQIKELSFAIYYKGLVYVAQKDKKRATEILGKLKAMNAPEAETFEKKLNP